MVKFQIGMSKSWAVKAQSCGQVLNKEVVVHRLALKSKVVVGLQLGSWSPAHRVDSIASV